VTRRLVAVVAHPDDDTFGCSGTVALHADDPDLRFVLVHATSGEAGMISDPSLATRETLGAVREGEDRRSWVALGREPDRHEFLRYPDSGLEDIPFEELVERIGSILREERPHVVMTFGPEGITGHADHIRVGEVTSEAFHRCRTDGGDGFQRLLHVALSETTLADFSAQLVALGRDPIDPTQPFQPRGVPDGTIGVVIDCSPIVHRKQAAILEHATQRNDLGDLPEELEAEIFRYESHVIAWPQRPAGTPELGDVFEGLD
jgi:LmbE family N-acetylglucosaminyl deacetylase